MGLDHIWASLYVDADGDTGLTDLPLWQVAKRTTGTYGQPMHEALRNDESFAVFKTHGCVPFTNPGVVLRQIVVMPTYTLAMSLDDPAEVVAEPEVDLVRILETARAKAGLPVQELAALFDVSRRQFYNWLTGAHRPAIIQEERIRRAAQVIDVVANCFPAARDTRAALLTQTAFGSVADALRADDPGRANLATDAVCAAGPDTVRRATNYDAQATSLLLEHLRDTPRRDDPTSR